MVIIKYDTLRFILYTFLQKAVKTNDWIAPLGMLASLLLTVIVSDFKDRLGLSAVHWETIVYTAIVASILWLIYALRQSIKAPRFESILQEIVANSQERDERRALFFLKTFGKDNMHRVLVYHDVIWGCYLLPHMKLNEQKGIELEENSLKGFIASSLGVDSNDVSLKYFDDADLDSYTAVRLT
jgi:hypothetical protein